MKQIITTVIETGYQFNNRFTKIINGIASACKAHSYTFNTLGLSDITNAEYDNQPIIVLGASVAWVTSAVDFLCQKKYHPIVVGFNFQNFSCTFITQNHALDAYTQAYWFLAKQHRKCAFLGFNPESFCDRAKYSGLLLATEHTGHHFLENDIFKMTTSSQCVDDFISKADNYDTIFCSNDTVALLLISKLKSPELYNIISFGDLYLKQYCSVFFHSLSPDYFNIGKIAVEMHSTLASYSSIVNSTIYVKSNFNTSAIKDVSIQLPPPPIMTMEDTLLDTQGLADENATKIDWLNNALERCNDTDIDLLTKLQKNLTYEQIAEQLYMSTNSVKRRLKRILTNAHITNKKQFLATTTQLKLDFSLYSPSS